MTKKILFGITLFCMISCSFAQSNDMQEGYNYQANKINTYLETQTEKLNSIFDFNNVAINGTLNPAWVCNKVPIEEISQLKQGEFCVNDKKYPVISLYKNELTKEQITWRDYLLLNVTKKDVAFKDNQDFKKGIDKANIDYKEKFDMANDMYMRMLKFKIIDIKSAGIMNTQKSQPDATLKIN